MAVKAQITVIPAVLAVGIRLPVLVVEAPAAVVPTTVLAPAASLVVLLKV